MDQRGASDTPDSAVPAYGRQSAEEPSSTTTACRQCRARKVKCDRSEPRCRGCTRLQLQCSFSRRSPSHSPEEADDGELTQAGTKRKRSRRACHACRIGKFKCNGRYPCERCVSRGLTCKDTRTSTSPGNTSYRPHSSPENRRNVPAGCTLPSADDANSILTPDIITAITNGHLTITAGQKAAIRGCLEAYLNSTDREFTVFLHKPTVFADFGKGRLDATLLKTLVALGWQAIKTQEQQPEVADRWLKEVQDDVLKHLGRTSIPQLQVLILLTQFHIRVGDNAEAWNLLPLAARMAFTLRLNYEREELDTVAQETRRRLAWAIYELDRFFCGGIQDLAVCLPEMMHIRLPCDEQSFQRGVASRAGFLDGVGPQDAMGMDLQAFLLKQLATRERILRYTKRIRREGTSPHASYLEMESLQGELDAFERNLPVDLKLNTERLTLMVHSDESVKYVSLHVHWMQCHCDLYRFCVPGLRESASKEALAQTPPYFIRYCQMTCLKMAFRLCDFWEEIWELEPSERASDRFLPVSIYQVAQILRHLRHHLPQEGEHCVSRLQQKLYHALKLAEPLKHIFRASKKCLMEAERVIRSLGETLTGHSTRASSVADDVAQGHLASRFSLVPRIVSDSQASEVEVEKQPALEPPGSGPSVEPAYDAAQAMIGIAGTVQDAPQPIDNLVPWDPFDVQMNDYYDPGLGDFLTPLSPQHAHPLNF